MAAKRNRFPTLMKSIAAVSALLTLLLAFFARRSGFAFSAAITCGTVCYHFSMRLLVGLIVPLFTGKLNPHSFWFRPKRWETKLYKVLRVRRWKGSIPTYAPQQFDLSQNTLPQIIHNMCNAELVHEVIISLSWIPLLFAIPFGSLSVFVITSAAAAAYDSIFVIAQRYNRPRLMRIAKRKEGCAL